MIKQNKDKSVTKLLRTFFTTKVFIIYDTKYGNTKLVAEQITEGLREAQGIETVVDFVKNIEPNKIADCGTLVFGAPNHMGKASRTMTKFIDGLSKVELNGKRAAAFDTFFQRSHYFETAMKKLEKYINCKLPNLEPISPGLSIKVNGGNGPIADEELPKAKEFGMRIALLVAQKTSVTSF